MLVFSHGSIGAGRLGMWECDRYLQIHSDIPTLHFTLSPALDLDDVLDVPSGGTKVVPSQKTSTRCGDAR